MANVQFEFCLFLRFFSICLKINIESRAVYLTKQAAWSAVRVKLNFRCLYDVQQLCHVPALGKPHGRISYGS